MFCVDVNVVLLVAPRGNCSRYVLVQDNIIIYFNTRSQYRNTVTTFV